MQGLKNTLPVRGLTPGTPQDVRELCAAARALRDATPSSFSHRVHTALEAVAPPRSARELEDMAVFVTLPSEVPRRAEREAAGASAADVGGCASGKCRASLGEELYIRRCWCQTTVHAPRARISTEVVRHCYANTGGKWRLLVVDLRPKAQSAGALGRAGGCTRSAIARGK